MGRWDTQANIAKLKKTVLRGGSHAVERVLNVRRVGRTLQVLVRWRGVHDDQWQTWPQCNQGTKMEAKEMERRKFPPRARPPGPRPRPRGAADRSHLRRGAGSPPPAKRRRLLMADGRWVPVDRGSGTPVPLGPTPEGMYRQGGWQKRARLAHRVGVAGGGRAPWQPLGGVAEWGAGCGGPAEEEGKRAGRRGRGEKAEGGAYLLT